MKPRISDLPFGGCLNMAVLTVLGFALLGWGVAHAEAPAMPLDKLNTQIDLTNLVVGNIDQGGFCSGTVIDIKRRLIMTADHCAKASWVDVVREIVDPKTGEVETKTIRQKSELEVWHNLYREFKLLSSVHYRVKVVAEGSTDDVAVLQILDDKYVPPAAVKLAATDSPTRGEHIWAVANPYVEFDNSLTEGRVTGENRTANYSGDHDEEFFEHSAETAPGSSGGAILNDQGEIIGTIVRVSPSGIGLAVAVGKLKKLLASVNMKDVYDNTPVVSSSSRLDDK